MWVRKQCKDSELYSKSVLKVHKKTVKYSDNLKLHDHTVPQVMGYNK